jgi:hypothetical protein
VITLKAEPDDAIPIADSRELARAGGLPDSVPVGIGTDHRLAEEAFVASLSPFTC